MGFATSKLKALSLCSGVCRQAVLQLDEIERRLEARRAHWHVDCQGHAMPVAFLVALCLLACLWHFICLVGVCHGRVLCWVAAWGRGGLFAPADVCSCSGGARVLIPCARLVTACCDHPWPRWRRRLSRRLGWPRAWCHFRWMCDVWVGVLCVAGRFVSDAVCGGALN